MAYNSRNIIVGAAAVYLSADTSLSASWPAGIVPAGTTGVSLTTALDASTLWKSTGYTNNGVEFAYTPTYGEITVDQLLDAAKLFKSKMTATVKTSLAEGTLENLLVSWAQDAAGGEGQPKTLFDNGVDGGSDTTGFVDSTQATNTLAAGEEVLGIAAGALGIEPVERQMVFVGPSPRTAANAKRERVYHLRRVISVTASQHMLKRDAGTEFPVEFRLLPGTVSGAEYGQIRDRVIG